MLYKVENFKSDKFVLPCVVDFINYENHAVIDMIQHKDQLFKKEDEIEYSGIVMVIQKKIKDRPVQTDAPLADRLSFRKVRYFCIKKIS